ncbi:MULTISPECIES: class I SAM-dependent methyltransferase [unclassified Parafrankia]|uniref:class I SAM-dependent methyltransferase n=1 Tax=unclassified Parafrankia TaxID=2994368 RepID=UPI000DA4E2C6|nr:MULTISPECIES: class I SAM-dependent methyltransferase [unclassified Parafrankia]TCJ35368.1 class I SAM-dependent methyltransferase [Parafrankia sp. BMG5.11]CAI7979025.1 Class I SAM-dependent methyltransferase [Frankia sp. Hr75.2]SQD99279.1 Methyltransferase type 11 [Parafrankia sp. Ea1.12]
MLTVDFTRFPVPRDTRVLDLGCGAGRHSFEAFRRGAHVIALDYSADEVTGVGAMLAAMSAEGQVPAGARAAPVRGDALALPFADDTFDRVIAAEVLEHLPEDTGAMAELARVLRPGGFAAVTVPARLPERVCWALSDDYHNVEGGHIRIYRRDQLIEKLRANGLELVGQHRAHSLHAPYWWLRCLVGVHDDDHPATKLYHRLLVWDMMRRPALTRTAERLLDPVLGKSIVLYLRKPRPRPEPPARSPTQAGATTDAQAVAAADAAAQAGTDALAARAGGRTPEVERAAR